MIWYKEFGFKHNPLCIKPIDEFELFFDDKNLIKDVIKHINQQEENLVLIGPLGTGKTSILKKIIQEFGGKRKLYYYNAYSASTPLNFEKVLKRAGNLFSRTFGKKSKDVILFIDEAHHLSPENLEDLEEYLDKHFRSIILATSKQDYEVPKELREEFKKIINLENFTEKDAHNIIKDRLGEDYEDIIKNKEIKQIYKESKTPRDFLLRVEEHCKQKHE